MRVVIAGGSIIGRELAQQLIGEKHDVALIESREDIAKRLAEELDCTVIHGDPTDVNVLREAGVGEEVFFVATLDDDRDNIIAGIAAKSLGAENVVLVLNNESFERLALNIGLYSIVSPSKLAALQIMALIKGFDIANLTTVIKGDARFFTGVVGEGLDGVKVGEVKVPGDSLIIAVYRGDEFFLPKPDLTLRKGDEVVVITRESNLAKVEEFFSKNK